MPINRGDIPFIGIHDGLCGYISHDRNIVRVASRLTGARVKVDPAFKGFRASGNRMKLGVDKVVITKKLQELYIDPMLQQPVKRQHYFPDISELQGYFYLSIGFNTFSFPSTGSVILKWRMFAMSG